MKFRETDNQEAANVVKSATPTKCVKQSYKDIPLRPELTRYLQQMLYIFVKESLSRKQYKIIIISDKRLFSCYIILQRVKKD